MEYEVGRLLKDADGRELLLPKSLSVDAGVLSVDGKPLFLLDDPQRLDPGLLDMIADAVPGAVRTAAREAHEDLAAPH